jgi:N-acetylmuramoyl-L-alanine amidase
MHKLKKLLLLSIILLLSFPYEAFAYKVVVDAGHGGKDSGAIGVNGLQEKNVNLDIALKLKQILKGLGYEAILTREDDRYLSLAERVDFANQQNADMFVSIHANSYRVASSKGTMVLYYDDAYPQQDYPASDAMRLLTPYSKQLAQNVLDSFLSTVGTVNQGLVPGSIYVNRMGTIPSILVETAFLSNSQDAAILADDNTRTQMAQGIAQGIAAFKPPVFVDTVGHWAREAILRMKDKGLVEGLQNRYQPDRALTRAEFVTLMDRMFHLDKLQNACTDTGTAATVTGSVYGCNATSVIPSFKDLATEHWAYPVLTKALKLNLLQGYADGTIRPNQPITRAEVAALFERLLKASAAPAAATATSTVKPAVTSPFIDVPVNLWSAEAIYTLRSKGIINGITDTEFWPNQSITRAEIAVMMDRYEK